MTTKKTETASAAADSSTEDYGTWEIELDGQKQIRTASSPAEAVKFAFNGWTRKGASS